MFSDQMCLFFLCDIHSFGAAIAFFNIKGDVHALLKREAFTDAGDVHKIVFAVFRGNEPITLGFIEKFHLSIHFYHIEPAHLCRIWGGRMDSALKNLALEQHK